MAVMSMQRSLFSVTLSLSFFNFANGLVGVFVPLIMLDRGAALWQVCAFYLVYAVVKLFCNYPAILVTQRLGPHFGLGLGFVAGVVQFALLWAYTHTEVFALAYVAAAALAVVNAGIWNSMHIHISRVMSEGSSSSSLATMEVANQCLGVAAPMLGAAIGWWVGPGWLLAVAGVLVLLALVPLKNVGELGHRPEDLAAREPVTYRLDHAPRRDVFANFCFNIETAIGVMVWPIYLAVELGNYESIGAITALAGAVTVVVVMVAGHRGDRGHGRRVLLEGVTVSSVVDFVRLLPLNAFGITAVSVAYRASLAYMQNPWSSTYYAHTSRRGIPYVMSMEIGCDLAYLFLWGVLTATAALGASSTWLFAVAFVLAGVAAWGCLAISKPTELESTAPQV